MITPVLDHIVLDVHEGMPAAADVYRGLGFTLTPRGQHTLGSINHLAMFGTDYLELLGWPPGGGSGRPELEAFPRGLNGLVFKTDNADETFAQLEAVGLAAGPPRAFSRPVAVDGGTQDAKFRTVNVDRAKAGLGRIYFCEHITPELVWRPEWQAHPNGVTAIHSIVVESPAPDAVAEMFGLMFGAGGHTIQVGRPFIEIVGGAADRMSVLRFARKGDAETIPADRAGGVRLEFIGE